jgi:hypothetical protein
VKVVNRLGVAAPSRCVVHSGHSSIPFSSHECLAFRRQRIEVQWSVAGIFSATLLSVPTLEPDRTHLVACSGHFGPDPCHVSWNGREARNWVTWIVNIWSGVDRVDVKWVPATLNSRASR